VSGPFIGSRGMEEGLGLGLGAHRTAGGDAGLILDSVQRWEMNPTGGVHLSVGGREGEIPLRERGLAGRGRIRSWAASVPLGLF
jgi:hypothetical protein